MSGDKAGHEPGAAGYVLILRPVPAGADKLGRTPENRLRASLKALLRLFGMECVSCSEVPGNRGAESVSSPREPDGNVLQAARQDGSEVRVWRR